MSPAEVILRTAAVLVLVALAACMLASRRRDHTPVLGALFAAAVASFVVTSAPDAGRLLGGIAYPLIALCVGKAVFFWLFARGLFAEEFRIGPLHAGAVGVTVGFGLWQQVVFAPAAAHGMASGASRAAAAGFELLVLVFVILALSEALRGLGADLVERRRRLRIVFVLTVSGYLGVAVLVQGYNLALQAETPSLLRTANLALIATAAFAALWHLLQLRSASWLDPDPAGAKHDRLSGRERQLLAALQQQMLRQRVYREEGLTIRALAQRIGTREQVLRRVINQGLGYRNFNDFLHAHRVREACERLRRPEDARLPVLSIALHVGYGSIGPFNRAFKARTGMTPSRFRRAGG